MRAIHKYKLAAQRGDREAQRRIAQSYGYKHSVQDMPPSWFEFMARAGITFEQSFETDSGIAFTDSVQPQQQDPNLVDSIKL